MLVTPKHRPCGRGAGSNIRVSFGFGTLLLSAIGTGLLARPIDSIALVANVPHPLTRFFPGPWRWLERRFCIAGIAIGVFAQLRSALMLAMFLCRFGLGVKSSQDVRITRANLAPNMLAAGAFSRVGSKDRITAVTSPSHSLPGRPADEILAAGSRGERQLVFFRLGLHRLALLSENGLECGLAPVFLVLGLRCRMTRALLATDVLAVDADLVGAECGLATVAGTADAHTDGLGDTLNGHVGCCLPLSRFQGQSILGEQNAGLLLLDRTPVRKHGRFRGGLDGGLGFGLRLRTIQVSTGQHWEYQKKEKLFIK